MKKLICLLLAILMIATCLTGCKNSTDDISSISSATDVDVNSSVVQETFQKPENYASVVLVTINPQFRLYLDASGVVLALEPVNADAKSIENKISFENQKVDEVVNVLISVANDSGFVKADATIDIKITEVVDKTVVATDILASIKTAASQKLTELNVNVEITTSVDEQITTDEDVADNTASNNEPVVDTKPNDTITETPSCKHTKTKLVPISTGNNIIDSSKLDVVDHVKVCADCALHLALEKHVISNGKCTACGQSNLGISSQYPSAAGVSGKSGLNVAEINADGSISYNLIIEDTWWEAKGEFIDEWTKKIPEAEMLKAIRQKFVMSDAEFAKLKAQGSYYCSLGTQTYADGYFICKDPAAGGPGDYSHNIIGYKDNKNGTFTVYYDYLEGGPDVDASERVHEYYYAVEYTYSGASNLAVVKKVEDGYESNYINGWTAVVDSLRIKSIKKVTDISGITAVK